MSTNLEVRPNITWSLTVNNYTGSGYTHNQLVSSASWTIDHNLWFNPNIQIEDSSGDSVIPNRIIQNSSNQVTVEFQGSMSGKAYLS